MHNNMRMHLKIYLKGETFVLPCEPFFFPWRKYPACDCSLPDDPYNHEGLQPTRKCKF